jgi:hypothetical protein
VSVLATICRASGLHVRPNEPHHVRERPAAFTEAIARWPPHQGSVADGSKLFRGTLDLFAHVIRDGEHARTDQRTRKTAPRESCAPEGPPDVLSSYDCPAHRSPPGLEERAALMRQWEAIKGGMGGKADCVSCTSRLTTRLNSSATTPTPPPPSAPPGPSAEGGPAPWNARSRG